MSISTRIGRRQVADESNFQWKSAANETIGFIKKKRRIQCQFWKENQLQSEPNQVANEFKFRWKSAADETIRWSDEFNVNLDEIRLEIHRKFIFKKSNGKLLDELKFQWNLAAK